MLRNDFADEIYHKSIDEVNKIASECLARNQQDSAIIYFLVAGNKYDPKIKEVEKRKAIQALNKAGALCAFNTNDYLNGYSYLRRAYDLAEDEGYQDMMPEIKHHLANVYTLFDEDSRETKEMLLECFQSAKRFGRSEIMVLSFINLIVIGYDGDMDQFKELLSKDIPESTPMLDMARNVLIGITYDRNKQFTQARAAYRDINEIPNKSWIDSLRQQTLVCKLVANSFLSENKPDSALIYYKQMYKLASLADFHTYETEATKMQGLCYKQLGDTLRQNMMYVRYLEKKDSLQRANQITQLNSLRHKNEVESVEKKLNALAEKKNLQTVAGIALLIIIAMLLTFLIFLWKKNKKLQSLNAFLYEKTQLMLTQTRAPQIISEAATCDEEIVLDDSDSMVSTDEYTDPTDDKPNEKYQGSRIQDNKMDIIEEKINLAMNDVNTICNPDFSLDKLADLADSNTSYVSRVINERFGMSFSSLLGTYRIKEAVKRMNDNQTYGHLTIEAIGQSLGFRSRTSFTNTFKRVTGLTPSEYLKEAKRQAK